MLTLCSFERSLIFIKYHFIDILQSLSKKQDSIVLSGKQGTDRDVTLLSQLFVRLIFEFCLLKHDPLIQGKFIQCILDLLPYYFTQIFFFRIRILLYQNICNFLQRGIAIVIISGRNKAGRLAFFTSIVYNSVPCNFIQPCGNFLNRYIFFCLEKTDKNILQNIFSVFSGGYSVGNKRQQLFPKSRKDDTAVIRLLLFHCLPDFGSVCAQRLPALPVTYHAVCRDDGACDGVRKDIQNDA